MTVGFSDSSVSCPPVKIRHQLTPQVALIRKELKKNNSFSFVVIIFFCQISSLSKLVSGLYTVEPLYNGHHWGMKFGLYREVALTQGLFLVHFDAAKVSDHNRWPLVRGGHLRGVLLYPSWYFAEDRSTWVIVQG